MIAEDRPSTGIPGLDETIDGLRLGDNVVWHVDLADDFSAVVAPYIDRARQDGRRIVHVRFGLREPWLDGHGYVEPYLIDPTFGFESFTVDMLDLYSEVGPGVYYVFDP